MNRNNFDIQPLVEAIPADKEPSTKATLSTSDVIPTADLPAIQPQDESKTIVESIKVGFK